MKKNLAIFSCIFFFSGCYSLSVKDYNPSYTYFKLLQTSSQADVKAYFKNLNKSDKEALIQENNNPYGLGAVAITIYMGYEDFIPELINNGADVDYIGLGGLTALHMATKLGKDKTVNQLLDTYNAKPSLTINKQNLLHIAAQNPNNYALRELVKIYPEMVNEKDTLGNTPLFYAVKNRDTAAIKLLLRYKANPNSKDKFGLSILDYSINMNYDNITAILEKK